MTLVSMALSGCYQPIVDNHDVKRAKRTPQLPYKQLATEKTHSIAVLRLDELEPDQIAAIKKFSGVRDCLIDSEKTAAEPDLRLINWKTIYKRAELNVCLMRIFSSLEDFQVITDWTDFHYLSNYNGSPRSLENLGAYPARDGTLVHQKTFVWRDSLPFRGGNPVPRVLTDGYYVKVYFRQSDGHPILVSSKPSQSM